MPTKHKPPKWWYQPAEILFEWNEDDGKDYIVGIYVPAFDTEAQSESVYKEFERSGKILK